MAGTIWFATATLVFLALRQLGADRVREPLENTGEGSLTVVVAAHNEEGRIGDLIRTLQAQDHPDFRVIVVDDRSTDRTGAVVKETAVGDPRISLIRVDARPEGWQGRLWAQGIGVSEATTEWILFLSADQRLRSDRFLRAMVARYEIGGEDAVSVIGPFGGEHWWNRYWLDLFANNPLVIGTVFLVQEFYPRSRWLIGALGMRRSTLESLGGVRAAADCGGGAFDDFGWARALAIRNRSCRMVYHDALEDVSNWETFSDFWQGATRWVAGAATYRRGGWAIVGLLAIFLGIALLASLQAGLIIANGRLPDFGLLALAAILPTIGVGHGRWNQRPISGALIFWPGAVAILAIFFGGALARLRNRIVWRGEAIRVVTPPP